MNWIDMSDRDKLFNYAREYKSSTPKLLCFADAADSYFTDCTDIQYEPNIMEYDVKHFGQMKDQLTALWKKSRLLHPELIATIVSATTFKNMPEVADNNDSVASQVKQGYDAARKENYENINIGDDRLTFIYEF